MRERVRERKGERIVPSDVRKETMIAEEKTVAVSKDWK